MNELSCCALILINDGEVNEGSKPTESGRMPCNNLCDDESSITLPSELKSQPV